MLKLFITDSFVFVSSSIYLFSFALSIQPRIDPLDLLNCLGVLLSSNGGIKGPNEVVRVARYNYCEPFNVYLYLIIFWGGK